MTRTTGTIRNIPVMYKVRGTVDELEAFEYRNNSYRTREQLDRQAKVKDMVDRFKADKSYYTLCKETKRQAKRLEKLKRIERKMEQEMIDRTTPTNLSKREEKLIERYNDDYQILLKAVGHKMAIETITVNKAAYEKKRIEALKTSTLLERNEQERKKLISEGYVMHSDGTFHKNTGIFTVVKDECEDFNKRDLESTYYSVKKYGFPVPEGLGTKLEDASLDELRAIHVRYTDSIGKVAEIEIQRRMAKFVQNR